MLSISSSSTMFVRPSVHIRTMSPGVNSTSKKSISTLGAAPMALVIIFLSGCPFAWVASSVPFLTSSATSEWSFVTWVIDLSMRYNRLSPTLATYSISSAIVAATQVVPMPAKSGSEAALSYISTLATVMASRSILIGDLSSQTSTSRSIALTVYAEA